MANPENHTDSRMIQNRFQPRPDFLSSSRKRLAPQLFEETIIHKAPNVASVPQYSPLRYPGGKTWFYPFAKRWLLRSRKQMFVEPFVGGGSVGLTAAIEGLVEHVVFVEKDQDVAAFWKTVLGGDADWLAEKILNFDLTNENIDVALANRERSQKDRAFALVLCNRINHGVKNARYCVSQT